MLVNDPDVDPGHCGANNFLCVPTPGTESSLPRNVPPATAGFVGSPNQQYQIPCAGKKPTEQSGFLKVLWFSLRTNASQIDHLMCRKTLLPQSGSPVGPMLLCIPGNIGKSLGMSVLGGFIAC